MLAKLSRLRTKNSETKSEVLNKLEEVTSISNQVIVCLL